MIKANISTAKNNLSKLIQAVKKGETVIILDRDVPVARLDAPGAAGDSDMNLIRMSKEGLVSFPQSNLKIDGFINRPSKVKLKSNTSAVDILLNERRGSL